MLDSIANPISAADDRRKAVQPTRQSRSQNIKIELVARGTSGSACNQHACGIQLSEYRHDNGGDVNNLAFDCSRNENSDVLQKLNRAIHDPLFGLTVGADLSVTATG